MAACHWLWLASAFLAAVAPGAATSDPQNQIRSGLGSNSSRDTSEFTVKLVDAFNSGGCEAVRALRFADEARLPPFALGIVAYCHPDDAVSEALFARGAAKEGNLDSLYLLQARRRHRKDPKAAEPLWQKIVLNARSTAARSMAKDFLSGVGDPNEKFRLEDELGYYVSTQLTGGYETNPILQSLSNTRRTPSSQVALFAAAGLQQRLKAITLAANYALTFNYYPSNQLAHLWQNDFDVPVTLRAGNQEDLQLRPFGGFITLGGKAYSIYGGLTITGIIYRGNYRQNVQGTIFVDKYYFGSLRAQQGTHFRLEYLWERYPATGFLRFGAFIEHVQAGRDRDTPEGSIPYSHNDIGATGTTEYRLWGLLFGLQAKLTLRVDDNESTFKNASGASIVRRRQDFQISLLPSVDLPLSSTTDLLVTYRWLRRFSNMSGQDFADRNLESHNIGVSVKISWVNL